MDMTTYLHFDGTCEAAFQHYAQVLGGQVAGLMRFGDVPEAPPAFLGSPRVIHGCLKIGDRMLMGSDSPPAGFDPGPGCGPTGHQKPQGFRVNLSVDTPAEAERIFAAFADGGQIAMPMGETFFAHRFGMVDDRFGTPWMVICQKPDPAAG